MKKKLLIGFAFILAVVLLAFVIQKAGGIVAVATELGSAFSRHPLFVVVGILFFSTSLFCGITRWYILLRKLNLPLRYRDCIRLYAIGHFCNMLGPGALGGDVVKASWVAKTNPTKRTELITSIAAERFIGMVAMVFFVATICACSPDFFAAHTQLIPFRNMFFIIFLGVLIFLILLVVVNWGKYANKLKVREGGIREKLLEIFVRSWETLRVCLTHPWTTGSAFLISLLNHCVDVICYFILSRSLELTVRFRELLVVSPIANTVAAIPITPGGAGVRENILQEMLYFVGVSHDESAALGLLMFSTLLIWAIVGAIVGFFMRSNKKRR